MYERIILFWQTGDFYFSHSHSLSTGISNQAELIKREKTFWMESWETQKNKKVLFSLCYLESSLFRNLHSVWNIPPSSKLLYFFFQFPPHLPTSSHWLKLAFFSPTSTASHSHWLLYSLIPTTAPLLSFLLPSQISFSFSSLRVAHIYQHTNQRASLSVLQ